MKYSEFEREVEREGFNVDGKSGTVYVDSTTDTVMSISTDDLFMFDCDWSAFVHLNRDVQEKLFDLAYQLAKTPLAEREEEKRYYLRYDVPPLLRAVHAKPRYLYRRIYDGYIDTSFSQTNDSMFKTIFTESEIEQMDITGFIKVEVTPE